MARLMTLVIRAVSSAEGGTAARASEDDADGATAASTRGSSINLSGQLVLLRAAALFVGKVKVVEELSHP